MLVALDPANLESYDFSQIGFYTLGTLFSNNKIIKSVIFSSLFTTVNSDAFSGCDNLSSLAFSSSVTIGTNAFLNCPKLLSLVVPVNSITPTSSFPANATVFYASDSILSIVYPIKTFYDLSTVSINQIDNTAFANFTTATIVVIQTGTKYNNTLNSYITLYEVSSGSLTSIYPKTRPFYDLSALSTTSFAAGAFTGTTLTSLSIPDTITTIGASTFENGTTIVRNRVTYTIDSGNIKVTAVGDNSVILSSLFGYNVTSFAAGAFTGTTLTSLSIPSTVTTIVAGAFTGATITTLTIQSTVITIGRSTFANQPTIIKNGTTYTIVGSTATVTAFNNSVSIVTIESIMFSYPVTAIAANAFAGKTLSSITIPSSVLSIGAYAVSGCPNLTTVTIQ